MLNLCVIYVGGVPPSYGSGGGGGGSGGYGGGNSFERPGLGAPARSGKMRPGDELPDDCKLYVGNLSPNITDETLKAMMAPFGNVLHAVVLLDMVTQQSRGYGFVHMDNPSSAGSAAQALSGKPVDGKPLVVRQRSEPPGGGGRPMGPLTHHAPLGWVTEMTASCLLAASVRTSQTICCGRSLVHMELCLMCASLQTETLTCPKAMAL